VKARGSQIAFLFFAVLQTPLIPLPPPWRSGLVQQDGLAVTEKMVTVFNEMIGWMNKAIEKLPELKPVD
jgi:hypothetical protein